MYKELNYDHYSIMVYGVKRVQQELQPFGRPDVLPLLRRQASYTLGELRAGSILLYRLGQANSPPRVRREG